MLGQTEESKREKFIDTMPTIIHTHLITEKTWQETRDKAKKLEHVIRKCDPQAAALPTLAKGTTVPGLYSHMKNLPAQIQDDQYNYEDTNTYYHNKNYRGQSRGCRPYRDQNTG